MGVRIVYEKAPAKINLSIDVLGKREDGYHEVEMVMTTVDLADRVALSELPNDEIIVSLESRYVPNDERNLAYIAAKLFKDTYQIKKGVHIKIDKFIPVSAGLGGGSTDAAAVMRGLSRLWKLNISLDKLAKLGAKIGSDVPFCMYSFTALATGRGELVAKLPSPPACWVILAKLDIGVSTKTVFEQLNTENLPHPNTADVIQALHERDFSLLCNNLGNVLEKVTLQVHPEVAQLKRKMEKLGAKGVLMSGSGPTIYGLVEHELKAKRIYNGLKGFCKEVYIVRVLG